MRILLSLLLMLMTFDLSAENKLTLDMSIDQLKFIKPPRGVGKAGTLIFKTANINNNGIVLNLNNINNYFDSQIFVRPTFLGFTTQFGNYGFALDSNTTLNAVEQTELKNSKLIMDDMQLNLSGEFLSFFNKGMNVKVNDFRLYCQSEFVISPIMESKDAPPMDVVKNCYNFLTLNGTYRTNSDYAFLVFEGTSESGSKNYLEAKVKSFDLRKTQISANLLSVKSIANSSYTIKASEVNMVCAKDENVTEIDFEKIKSTCLNKLKLSPLVATMTDQEQKTQFNLDVKDVTIKDQVAYVTLNQAVLSNPDTVTTLSSVLLNCKKDSRTDILEITQVLNDCLDYSRISIAEIHNNKRALDKNGSSVRNIVINSNNSVITTQAEIKFLGFKAKVTFGARASLNETRKQLTLTVTDTKLPLGLTSVKILMYFLKKDLISKDIIIKDNVITISL